MKIFFLLIIGFVNFYGQVSDETLKEIISNINRDSLIATVRFLSGEDSVLIDNTKRLIRSREYSAPEHSYAQSFIIEKLKYYGYSASVQQFGNNGLNLLGEKKSSENPEKYYILCAHYDSKTFYCADDNASGAAAVLEAARVLKKFTPEYSMLFAFWDQEEIGLIGSTQFNANLINSNKDILGVINIDMIGYDGNNDGVSEIHSSVVGYSIDLANEVKNINTDFEIGLNPIIILPGERRSDHAPFWDNDITAVFLTEGMITGDFNPYYHSTEDRISKFNLNYFYKVSKMAIGAFAKKASIKKTVAINEVNEKEVNFSLGQNYPNPFNPSTNIDFSISSPGKISLKIYNFLGQEIATLVDEIKETGKYTVKFNSNNISSGIYYYILKSNSNSLSKKMILVK